MKRSAKISVIIPALNEAASIGKVLDAIPGWVDEVIVVDNGSTDGTAEVAHGTGARVIHEPQRGYGAACLAGIAALDAPDVVVFLDADFSDHPEEMDQLVDPIVHGDVDMVIGSRVRGERQRGALTPQARFGNWLACSLIHFLWRVRYTDLGPFRAIRRTTLDALGMRDRDYGWTVEMQVKAAQRRVRSLEVPVRYRKRIGTSKISGTLEGAVAAGCKILGTIFLVAFQALLSNERLRPPRNRVVVFTRDPEPGSTKTRMIPALGPEGAAQLQARMTEHIVTSVENYASLRRVAREVRYEGGDAERMRAWLGGGMAYVPQGAGDLGERLARTFDAALSQDNQRCVIIGSDCPAVTPAVLSEAFDALAFNDVVLGPAVDGGYYLIGLQRPVPQVFTGIDWGTDAVLRQTLEAIQGLGLRVAKLKPLRDVDRPEDLSVWEAETSTIRVVIPTFNEAPTIAQAIDDARRGCDVEVIVSDGGSTDDTVRIARDLGVEVRISPRFRAAQLNAGAAGAEQDVLLFLHADTRLPARYDAHVRHALTSPEVEAGAFRLRIDAPHAALRSIEAGANWRSRRLGMPYGDQALFVSRAQFEAVGGFPEQPIMEDYEILRRLKRRCRIAIAPAAVLTSARRWLANGIWCTTLTHQLLILGYHLGVAPARLARWLRR